MFVISSACGPLQANCYIVAPAEAGPCVIIDPGMEATPAVTSLLARHRLTPAAILATHGHVDHIADAAGLADAWSVPVWIRSEDRHLLTDPAAGLNADMATWLRLGRPDGLRAPGRVDLLDGRDAVHLAGLTFAVTHAPGHTQGSVLYTVSEHPGDESPLVFSGDVLFAGSIGRTDLPGGDPAVMRRTLREVVVALPDDARILPGHGPATVMRVERATNPYLPVA